MTTNLSVKWDCAKARSPLLLRWAAHPMLWQAFGLSNMTNTMQGSYEKERRTQ